MIYKKQKPMIHRFALLGLCNFAGLIGFYAASFVLKIDQKFVQKPGEKQQPVEKKKSFNLENIKWPVIGLIAALIVIFPMLFSQYYFFSWLMILLIFVFPCIGTIVMFIYGYSKDKQKTRFAILFSLFFIILTFTTQLFIRAALT